MKIFSFLLVVILAMACGSQAQMYARYDTYATYSLDANNNVYQTVVVEGTTTGSCCFEACSGGNCCNSACFSAIHTPKIYNVVGGAGGWSTGPGIGPFAYMSYQTTTTVQANPGQTVQASWEGDVFCSAIGQILGVGGNPIIGWAYTKEVWIGAQLQGFCAVTRACNNTTTPLCTAPSVYVGGANCSPAWNSYWVTVKIGTGPTQCFVAFSNATSDTSQEWCTPAP